MMTVLFARKLRKKTVRGLYGYGLHIATFTEFSPFFSECEVCKRIFTKEINLY